MTLPRERDWREVLHERYARRGNPRLGPLQVKVALPFLRRMDAAAKARNVNRATFIRRSVAVQIAATTGDDLLGLLAMCPSAKPWGDPAGPRTAGQIDEGANIAVWCPHPGCSGSHLH